MKCLATVLSIFLFPLVLNSHAFANEFHILELDELRVDYMSYFAHGRAPLITSNGLDNRELGKELDLSFNSSVLEYGYFSTLVHSTTDAMYDTGAGGQFRAIGMKLELGVRLSPYLDIYYQHHSQHTLDLTLPYGFPEYDAVGLHLYLYGPNRKQGVF